MKRILLFTFLLVSLGLFSNTEKYRLIYRTDPSTSVVVAWCQTSGSNPTVYYDLVDHGTNWGSYAFQNGVDRSESYKSMDHNFSRLSGLQPNTKYYFVIKDSDGTSSRFWFKTLPASSDTPLRIISGGDSRTNPGARRNANTLVSKLRPDFVMFGGDMTDTNLDFEWQDWFDDWQLTISSDGRMYPLIPTRGNHEWSNDDIYKMFDVIDANAIYALNVGGDMARIYTLNTEYAISGTQTTWLVSDLQQNYENTEWRLAQYHKPMRPHVGSKSEGNDQYFNWAQPFYDYNMNVVVECDAHTVKQTWPIKPSSATGSEEGFEIDSINGTVYIGEGCWGAPLRTNDDNKLWTRNSDMFNSFNLICMTKERIEIRTIGTDNASLVAEANDNVFCDLPANLDVWSPSNGDVVIIENPKYMGLPLVDIIYPQDNEYFTGAQSITIEANANDTNGTIQYVEFYANGVLIGTDNAAPWQVNYNVPANGATHIVAIAYDNDGYYQLDEVNIYSGSITISSQVSASNDDAEEDKADGSLDITSSDLELSVEDNIWPLSDDNQWVGMRFDNLNIPVGAIIDTAYIQFTVDETTSSSAISIVYGEKNYDATPFYELPNNISARQKTTNNVTWNIPAWNSVGAMGIDQRTPNLATIVQEIIDGTNWSPNNAMVMLTEGSGTRTAVSWDGDNAKAPILYITYHLDEAITGVKEVHQKQEINIYPNPTSNLLTIDLTTIEGQSSLKIYSLNGKKLLDKQIYGNQKNNISLKSIGISSGVYIVNVKTEEQSFTQKLIVK